MLWTVERLECLHVATIAYLLIEGPCVILVVLQTRVPFMDLVFSNFSSQVDDSFAKHIDFSVWARAAHLVGAENFVVVV